MVVWACIKDVGGMNAVLPVSRVIRSLGHRVLILANGKSVEVLPNRLLPTEFFIACRADEIAEEFSTAIVSSGVQAPSAFITSMCSGGGIGRNLVPVFKKLGIPTFAIQDFWGARLLPEWADLRYRPDFICVGDAIGRRTVIQAWPEFDPDKIAVTGYPAFDQYAQYDIESAQGRVKTTLGLKHSWPFILYCVENVKQTAEATADFIATLNRIRRSVYFIPRFHPAFKDQVPDEVAGCEEALSQFKSGIMIRDTKDLNLQSLVATATVVIGMYTTVLIEAAHLRRQAIAVLYPHIGLARFHEDLGSELMPEYPPVQLGAVACASNSTELEKLLEKSFENKLNLVDAQQKVFSLDGKSAERVARFILKSAP